MKRLDNDGISLSEFDVRQTNGGNTVHILHPGMSVATLNIETGKTTFNIFNSKIHKVMKLKKIGKRAMAKLSKADDPPVELIELLMELDTL